MQCPLDKATLDIAAALPIATSTAVTNLRQYMNSDLGYNDFKFQLLCSKIATVNCFEVAISNGLWFDGLNFTLFNQISFGNSDRAAYSDLKSLDGGKSLYPMNTVFVFFSSLLHPGLRFPDCQVVSEVEVKTSPVAWTPETAWSATTSRLSTSS